MATLHDNDNTLLALVRTTFDAHSAVLFLPDQSGNYTVALSSTDNEPSVQEVTIAPGKGLVGWILRHKQPVIVNNLDMRHTFLGYYDENDEGAISAFMGCHIPEGGALCVDSVRPRAYTEEDQLLLHRFARHLARASPFRRAGLRRRRPAPLFHPAGAAFRAQCAEPALA